MVALSPALSSACMFSLMLVVSDHMFCSATLASLFPAFLSACMFSLFIVVLDQ